MEIRSREIIKAINEKRIEKKIRILWPDSEVYEHLK